MHKPDIRIMFENYCADKRDRTRRQQIVSKFLWAINPWVQVRHDIAAEVAVKRVLVAADRLDIAPDLARDALQQLCRDHEFEFTPSDDTALIDAINGGTYFSPLDLRVDTQEGVI